MRSSKKSIPSFMALLAGATIAASALAAREARAEGLSPSMIEIGGESIQYWTDADLESGTEMIAVPVRIENDGVSQTATPIRRKRKDPFTLSGVVTWAAGEDTAMGAHMEIGLIIGFRPLNSGSTMSWFSGNCTQTGQDGGSLLITIPMCVASGLLVRVEAGAFGAAAGIGYGAALGIGTGGRNLGIMILPAMGIGAHLKLVRAWGDASTAERFSAPGDTLLGPELEVTLPIVLPLKLTAGFLVKISGDPTGPSFFPNVGFGFGF